MVLIQRLPRESWTHAQMALDEEKAKKPTVEQIRARAAHYAQQAEEAQ